MKNGEVRQMSRYPLIFNPQAKGEKGARTRRFLMKHEDRFELHATSSGDEAKELASKFARAGVELVLAAGGDGTLNAVVAGLAGSETALGIMPAGTMNVFARELGIPANNLEKALAVIDKGLIREVDLFCANGSPFVQMAGVGFDAQVIEETKFETKKKLGPLAYLLSAVKVLGEKPPMMEVETEDGRVEKGVAVLCGNGSLYGGQFRIFRNAKNTDSKLDVIVFKESGYRLVLDSLKGIAFGGIDISATTSYFQAGRVVVRSSVEVPVEVDGELLGRYEEVEFCEMSRRLRVVAPEEPSATPFGDALRAMLNWPAKSKQEEVIEAT